MIYIFPLDNVETDQTGQNCNNLVTRDGRAAGKLADKDTNNFRFFNILLDVTRKFPIFADRMITRQECIDTIKANAETIVQQFDVRSLRLFGSLARNEQRESSDVDVCVEMPPDMFQLIGLKQYLEELMGCDVDVVRIHRNIDDFLMNQIERDGIYIIRETSNRMAYA